RLGRRWRWLERGRGVGVARGQQERIGGGLRLVAERDGAQIAQAARHAPDRERRAPADDADDERDAPERRCEQQGGEPQDDTAEDAEATLTCRRRDREVDRVAALPPDEPRELPADEIEEGVQMRDRADEG